MLVDIYKTATTHWQEFTGRDLKILRDVSVDSEKAAAEIARSMGHVDVANEILERSLSDV